MSIRKTTIFITIVFSFLLLSSYLVARTWTSKSGTYTVEAEYVEVEDDRVVLRKQDGSLAKPKIQQLSASDQDFIKTKQQSDEKDIFAAVTEEKKSTSNRNVKGNSRTVTVEGVGSTFEEAKKDAFRNAVSKVVGTLVDAQTRVTREGIIEQMLTASNAYVEEHKILSRKQKDGLWEITMEAIVESQAVQMRLMPPTEETIEIDGSSLAGKIQTKDESENAAVLLLAKAIKDQNYPYSVMEVSGEMEKEPVKKEGDSVTMRINVTVRANAEKFDEFRKKIEPILDKIALSKNNMTLKMSKNGDSYRLDSLPNSNPERKEGRSKFLHVNTSRNNNLTNTGWKSYELPNKTHAILIAYASIAPCIEIELCNTAGNAIVTDSFVASLFRANVESLFSANVFFLNCSSYSNDSIFCKFRLNKPVNAGSSLGTLDRDNGIINDFLFSPFFGLYDDNNRDNQFYPANRFSRELTMDTTELSAIKNLKFRIATQNREMDEYYKKLSEMLNNWQLVNE
jgi:hypothetical protein